MIIAQHVNKFVTIYYQILEYVIFPIGLILLIFYIKNLEKTSYTLFKGEHLWEGLYENMTVISSTFLLYYFSINAHSEFGEIYLISARIFALVVFILGLLFIIILKYHGIKDPSSGVITAIFRYSILGFILLMVILIFYFNSKGKILKLFGMDFIAFLYTLFSMDRCIFTFLSILILYLFFREFFSKDKISDIALLYQGRIEGVVKYAQSSKMDVLRTKNVLLYIEYQLTYAKYLVLVDKGKAFIEYKKAILELQNKEDKYDQYLGVLEEMGTAAVSQVEKEWLRTKLKEELAKVEARKADKDDLISKEDLRYINDILKSIV